MPANGGEVGSGVIAWFARNHAAANALMLVVLLGGLAALSQIIIERHPEYDPRTITVTVPFPGATQSEIEEDITRRIEESVSGIVGVERVLSSATEDSGTVTLELMTFADAEEVLDKVRTAVERIEYFPPRNADEPEIVRTETLRTAMTLAVSSSTLDEDGLRLAAEDIRENLLALPTVSAVLLVGARDREIQVELSEETLRRYHLTFNRLVSTVRRSSFNSAGGELHTDAGEVKISALNKRNRAEEYGNIVIIAQADGSIVRLRDVSTLRDGFLEADIISEVDGQPTIFVKVLAASGQNPHQVVRETKQAMSSYAPPPGVELSLWHDELKVTLDRLSTTLQNGVLGLVLVFIALLLIFDLRMTIWITAGIPISFIGSLILFDTLGLSMSAIALYTFFVVLGLVVDDAIVVGESIAKQWEQGKRGAVAAIAGVRAVAGPVIIGATTTIVVFCAILPLDTPMGQVFSVMPLVVGAVLLFSLLEVFCILPAHLSDERPWSLSPLKEFQTRTRRNFDTFIQYKLVNAIATAVNRPYITVIVFFSLIIFSAVLFQSGVVHYNAFSSSLGAERLQVDVTMPMGTQFEVTRAAAEHLAEAARIADRESGGNTVEAIAVLVGEQKIASVLEGERSPPKGDNLATVEVKFKPERTRALSELGFLHAWSRSAGDIPGAENVLFRTSAASPPSVSYSVIHEDIKIIEQAVSDLRNAYNAIDAIYAVEDPLIFGKRRYEITLTDEGFAAGLTEARVADQLRDSFYGAEVQRIQRGRDEIKVNIRYPRERRSSIHDLSDERIITRSGVEVPLKTVAQITETWDYESLDRIDGTRSATVTGQFDPDVAGSREIRSKLERETLPMLLAAYPDLKIQREGSTRDAADTGQVLKWSFPLALLIIYALLAAQLRGFGLPFLALAGIPMAVVGSIIGHIVLGYTMTTGTIFGIIAVSGVVVNDTLLLLDRYNHIRAEYPEIPRIAAISGATMQRARPILLTTLTTFIGLLPLIYDKSESVIFLKPLVVSMSVGLLFASVGLLFFLPAALMLYEQARSSITSFNFTRLVGK